MAFKRKIDLFIGKGSDGLSLNNIDLQFRVSRSLTFSENTAEITVYNLKQETRNKILKKGNNVIFKAGYDDEQIKTIFIGQITEVYSEKRGADILSKIQASAMRSDKDALEYITVSPSYSAGVSMDNVINDLATAGGLVVTGISNVNFSLPNGWSFAGSYNSAMREIDKILKSQEIGLYIDNAEIIIYKIGQPTQTFGSVYLTYGNGLLSVDDVTKSDSDKKIINWKSLLISDIQPAGLLAVETDKISGAFIVERVLHEGDNFGGDFSLSGVAIAC